MGLLVVCSFQQPDVGIPPVVLGRLMSPLAEAKKSLFCFWFLLCMACTAFAGCLWSLLQILLVVHASWLPDPSLGFSSGFLLTLWLGSIWFLGQSCKHAFLFKPLAAPNLFFCLLWFWTEIGLVPALASKPALSYLWPAGPGHPVLLNSLQCLVRLWVCEQEWGVLPLETTASWLWRLGS